MRDDYIYYHMKAKSPCHPDYHLAMWEGEDINGQYMKIYFCTAPDCAMSFKSLGKHDFDELNKAEDRKKNKRIITFDLKPNKK